MKSDRVPRGLPQRSIRPPARSGGQSLVEFGLIALTLVFLIGAGVDLGLMVTVRQNVSVATGEAARQAAYGVAPTKVVLAARRAVTGTLAIPAGLAVSVKYCHQTDCMTYCDGFLDQDPVKPQSCQTPIDTSPGLPVIPGDFVTVTLWEEKYEILTPWLRAWAASPAAQDDLCQRGGEPCFMRLTSAETVVYPGRAS